MSSLPAPAASAPSGPALSAMAWMYVATLALLATLAMATLTVANRLAAAALLLLLGAAGLVFWPLLRRTRRYAEALLDAEAALHDQHELDAARLDGRGDLTAVNSGRNLTVLSEAPQPAGRPELEETAHDAQGIDGTPVLAPASLPGDGWSDTVARITYLQRPSRRGSAARTAGR